MEVTNDRDRRLEASAANAPSPTPTSSTADASERVARYPSDAVLSDLHERLPSSIDYSFLKPVHQPAPGATEVSGVRRKATNTEIMQGRLDDFRDRFSGPYRVDGQGVRARPMFRMNTADAFNRELRHGGYRRDTWIYDASSGRWATLTPEAPRLLYCDARGPQGEIFAGAFRPASEMPR